ncbi:MAG: phage DNA encapsidation protein [Candidatus Coprovivens sp.]
MLLSENVGVGKTYSISKFSIKDFINKDNQFAYIRRYKSDLKEAVPQFFDALIKNEEFSDVKLNTKGKKFYCNDNICGHAMTLSTAQDLKSSNFNKVKNLIFDEFMIEEGQKKYYLKNEVEIFLNLVETIARLRDVRIFLLGNAVSVTNPYFLYFDLSLPYNSDIKTFRNGTILVNYTKNQEYREVKRKSRFGEMTKRYFF